RAVKSCSPHAGNRARRGVARSTLKPPVLDAVATDVWRASQSARRTLATGAQIVGPSERKDLTLLPKVAHDGAGGSLRPGAFGSWSGPVAGGRWHVGQRGSHRARYTAIAIRIVMNESTKWRSGREADLFGLIRPSRRGGKVPHAFSNDERVAA